MQIAEERGWEVVRVWGDVDLASAPRVRSACIEAVQRAASRGEDRGVAVDLVGVDLLDSTGLGVLIGALRRARERNLPFALLQPPPPIVDLLALVGLDRVFDVAPSLADLGVSEGSPGAGEPAS